MELDRADGPEHAKRRILGFATVAAAAALLGGCGAGAGQRAEGAELLVTRDFGATELVRTPQPKQAGGDTAMRFLSRNAKVETRDRGGVVQAINGTSSDTRGGRRVDWVYFVNGVRPDKNANELNVRDGHRIWWDRHDRADAENVHAVVGSFPEPFRTGWEGRRLPVRIECSDPGGDACDEVYDTFTRLGIVVGRGGLGTSGGDTTLRVLVGPFADLVGRDYFAKQLSQPPRVSGVFARFRENGKVLETFNGRGERVRRLGPGSGLIAAGRDGINQPTWVVTGTDNAGVDAALPALNEATLTGKFAYAVAAELGISLPERQTRTAR